MSNTELTSNMLAEVSTKDISAATNPKDFEESKKIAKQGGNVQSCKKRNWKRLMGKSSCSQWAKNSIAAKIRKRKRALKITAGSVAIITEDQIEKAASVCFTYLFYRFHRPSHQYVSGRPHD